MLVISLVLWRLHHGNATLTGINSIYILRRLQSVLNTAARIIVGLPRSSNISTTRLPTIIGYVPSNASSLNYWLCSSAVFNARLLATFCWLHPSCWCAVLSISSLVFNQCSQRSDIATHTVGDRAFPVVGAALWNGLPVELTSLQGSFSFRRHIKNFVFRLLYPDFRCLTI